MLIDATHPEETRVVVVSGTRLEEFDVESATRKQLKGNIYLAKVVRVEPSLQAAFVDYGGNRHGFLAFSEIHPDYYQVPVADREALLAAHEREAAEAADADDEMAETEEGRPEVSADSSPGEPGNEPADRLSDQPSDELADAADDQPTVEASGEEWQVEVPAAEPAASPWEADTAGSAAETGTESVGELSGAAVPEPTAETGDEGDWSSRALPAAAEGVLPTLTAEVVPAEGETPPEPVTEQAATEAVGEVLAEPAAEVPTEAPARPASIETLGGDDIEEARAPRRQVRSLRNYKIQEVVKRRQILLVQVVKEERGNKGAALTTYLSLAGRYCVLMPNTPRGGGVSRKITSGADRKRLKTLLGELDIPEGMGVIVRTAGSERSRTEIKRDLEYLMRLWDSVRELTLQSTAPALVYEEGSIIKRAIRDLYTSDIEEIVVEGEDGYRTAKDFMKMLIPSHAKKVQPYRDESMALFQRYQVESQLDAMHNPVVHLKSGGYIVINPTEALVAIDVNSGRATRERNIEETALRTNLEAADEIARQLRLRDLAGLIVIDFIDMEVHRNQSLVERRLKEAMRSDRARIQIGRISAFGLLELSRQRLRPSLIETSSVPCPHCGGTGIRRSTESTALHILRAIEEEGARRRSREITVHLPTEVALYILNHKRTALADIEKRCEFRVLLAGDDSLIPPDHRIERVKGRPEPAAKPVVRLEQEAMGEEEAEGEAEAEAAEPVAEEEARPATEGAEGEAQGGGRRRRRRRRRRGRGGETDQPPAGRGSLPKAAAGEEEASLPVEADDEGMENAEEDGPEAVAGTTEEGEQPRRRRRRGRRGGRRRHRDRGDAETAGLPAESEPADESHIEQAWSDESRPAEEPASASAPEPAPAVTPSLPPVIAEDTGVGTEPAPAETPRRRGWWNKLMS
jgi:ribonuclease E